MFWKFSVGLFIASIIFPFVYSFLALPAIGLMLGAFGLQKAGEATGHQRSFSVLRYPLVSISFLTNVYILAGWSAYAAARAFVYSSHPGVTQKWMYTWWASSFVMALLVTWPRKKALGEVLKAYVQWGKRYIPGTRTLREIQEA